MERKQSIRDLEVRWSRYKYVVLEKSPSDYIRIRQLLKDKTGCPAEEFQQILDRALCREGTPGEFANGAQHVWGYFKGIATAEEKNAFARLLQAFVNGQANAIDVRRMLYQLARKYDQAYLLDSHYFDEVK